VLARGHEHELGDAALGQQSRHVQRVVVRVSRLPFFKYALIGNTEQRQRAAHLNRFGCGVGSDTSADDHPRTIEQTIHARGLERTQRMLTAANPQFGSSRAIGLHAASKNDNRGGTTGIGRRSDGGIIRRKRTNEKDRSRRSAENPVEQQREDHTPGAALIAPSIQEQRSEGGDQQKKDDGSRNEDLFQD
jgi:hypothetical protein